MSACSQESRSSVRRTEESNRATSGKVTSLEVRTGAVLPRRERAEPKTASPVPRSDTETATAGNCVRKQTEEILHQKAMGTNSALEWKEFFNSHSPYR